MSRHALQLPGEAVLENAEQVKRAIREVVLAGEQTPLQAMVHWEPMKDIGAALLLVDAPRYYMLYEHPVDARKNSMSSAPKDEVLRFLRQRIRPTRGEGLDITVSPEDLSGAVVCNHDGDIFVVRHRLA